MDRDKKSRMPRGIVFLGLLTVIGLGTRAQAGAYSQIVTFGDSLSDVGNVFAATGGAIPPAALGYVDGRFSNGPIWIDHLAAKLKVAAPTPSFLGGTDYAWGYAQSGSGTSPIPIPNVNAAVPNLLTQVGQFLGTNPTLDSGTLLTVWAGANDFLHGNPTDPNFVPTLVGNIVNAVATLAGAGGSQFVVANLPALSLTPYGRTLPPAQQAGIDYLVSVINGALKTNLDGLEQTLGITIHQVDIHSYFQEIINNPSAFGLTNVTDPMQGTGQTSGYLFWDDVHPTTQVHELIADLAFASVVPEPSSIVMLGIAGVALTAGAGVRHRRGRRAA